MTPTQDTAATELLPLPFSGRLLIDWNDKTKTTILYTEDQMLSHREEYAALKVAEALANMNRGAPSANGMTDEFLAGVRAVRKHFEEGEWLRIPPKGERLISKDSVLKQIDIVESRAIARHLSDKAKREA